MAAPRPDAVTRDRPPVAVAPRRSSYGPPTRSSPSLPSICRCSFFDESSLVLVPPPVQGWILFMLFIFPKLHCFLGNLVDEERMLVLFFDRTGWPTSLPTSEKGSFMKSVLHEKLKALEDFSTFDSLPLRPGVEKQLNQGHPEAGGGSVAANFGIQVDWGNRIGSKT